MGVAPPRQRRLRRTHGLILSYSGVDPDGCDQFRVVVSPWFLGQYWQFRSAYKAKWLEATTYLGYDQGVWQPPLPYQLPLLM